MNIIKLDSSDIQALEQLHKTKGVTRYVFPAFGVSRYDLHGNSLKDGLTDRMNRRR